MRGPTLEHFWITFDWDVFLSAIRKVKPAIGLLTLRFVTNSWTTSARMHEDRRLPCLFGCAGEADSQQHYIGCPELATCVGTFSCASGLQAISNVLVFRSVGEAIANLKIIAFITLAYHSLKRGYLGETLMVLEAGQREQIRAWTAQALRAAAEELNAEHSGG